MQYSNLRYVCTFRHKGIAAPVFNVQITIQLQPYPIVFRTAHLRPITPGGSFSDIANLALLKTQQAAFGDMGREQVERMDTGHGWLPRSFWNMGSLLVWATFGEMAAGRFALQSGKRSSEKGFQTTFGLGRKGSSLERPRVSEGTHAVWCRLRRAY